VHQFAQNRAIVFALDLERRFDGGGDALIKVVWR
jgi:hypothetical protein